MTAVLLIGLAVFLLGFAVGYIAHLVLEPPLNRRPGYLELDRRRR